MKLAFMFPGQGAHSVGMGQALAQRFPLARETFETADRVLGFPLSEICWKGPAEELTKTVHTQPALLVHSVAALRVLEAAGLTPSFTAGHSLGEYSACVAAGVLTFEDALRLVHVRGRLMHEAGIERPGTMAALLKMKREDVVAVCDETEGVVVPANFNAPGQIVISGEKDAVAAASELAKSRGGRAVGLVVGGAFHSPLMASAAAGLAKQLDATSFAEPRCPVIVNVSAQPLDRADDLRAALKDQLLGAVLWEDSMRLLVDRGVDRFIEVGTGKVLRGLLKKIDSGSSSLNVDDPDSIEETFSALGVTAPTGGG